MSFKHKISMQITLAVTAILIVIAVSVYYSFVKISHDQIAKSLDYKIKRLAAELGVETHNEQYEMAVLKLWSKTLTENEYVELLDDTGKVVYKSKEQSDPVPLDKVWTKICAESFHSSSGKGVITVQMFVDTSKEDHLTRLMKWLLISGVAIGIGLAYAISYFVAGSAIKPVRRMTEEVNGIDVDQLKQRLQEPASRDEIHQLSTTFNSLFDRIEEGFEKQRQFTADASHELKTPLTSIEGHAKLIKRWGKDNRVILDESIDFILKETDRLSRITGQLLELSQLENKPAANQPESLPVREVIHTICKHYESMNRTVEINDFTSPAVEPVIHISKDAFSQLCINLMDNAVKYSGPASTIHVHIHNDFEAIQIEIKDEGIGIAAEDLPFIWDRFYRVDKSRSATRGTGLGLSICKKIVQSVGGSISISSEINKGTSIVFSIPYAQAREEKSTSPSIPLEHRALWSWKHRLRHEG